MPRFTPAQQRIIDAANAAMANAQGDGAPGKMSAVLEEIFAAIENGNVGIESNPADIDSLSLGGGAFSQDVDNSYGLTFGYKAGRIHTGKAPLSVAAGTIALSPSSTNYIEVDGAGSVSVNTTGFTSGRLPLYTVVTGVSSIATVTSSKPLLTLLKPRGVDGLILSAAAATKEIVVPLGNITATTAISIITPSHVARLSRASLAVKTAVTANDSDYWTFGITNKLSSGSGAVAMLAAGAGNTTQSTGGSGLSAYVKRVLGLSSTPANLDTASEDVLEVSFTKTGSAADLVQGFLKLEFMFDV